MGLAVRVRSAIWALRTSSSVEAAPRRRGDAVDLLVGGHGLGGFDGLEPFRVAARPREQHPVERAARPELVVRSGVEHRAVVDHDDAVGQRERRAAVRDEDGRARAGDPAERRVDLLLDAGVDRGGRVVEQQDLRIGEQRACERDPLALAPREREALLADDRVVALGQLQDELVGLGGARRGLDLLACRVGACRSRCSR